MSNFDWDEAKRASNLLKHGLDFFDVNLILDGPHVTGPGHHGAGSEERFKAIGMLFDLCATTIYTKRGDVFRIVSLRPAKRKERTRFHASLHER